MRTLLDLDHHGLRIIVVSPANAPVLLRHLGHRTLTVPTGDCDKGQQVLVEVQAVGWNQLDHHGLRYTGTQPGSLLRFHAVHERIDNGDRVVGIEQRHASIAVTSWLRLITGLPVIRCWTEVQCIGSDIIDLDYVSSFAVSDIGGDGVTPDDQRVVVQVPHNVWFGEAQWQAKTLGELGFNAQTRENMQRFTYGALGTWSSCGYLPMGALEDHERGTVLGWQLEHHGSWLAEYSYRSKSLHLRLSGPTHNEHHWSKRLAAGDSFTTVPVAVAACAGGLTEVTQALTAYRRRIVRPHRDHQDLPVIFNDYMNCLNGDPTTARLLPLIDAAATAGCEYFCIDCGWYSEGLWWDGVGQWLPAVGRFPGGIDEPIKYIRARGMIPGLWLELEVMGINCPLASQVPDDWFICRRGRRVIDHSRYQLDYRNPAVRAHADEVIDRLVRQYGVGYIKMDYNINAGAGTDLNADSVGDGLLGHQRAYLTWLDAAMDRHPELIVENCGSGGMRMDYALLARHQIQSVTDQTDYRLMIGIAAACASGCLPEQAAIWSYPLRTGDRDEVVVNMVNAMLLRIHQSGHLGELSPERLALVQEGIATYKAIRHLIPVGLPLWPLGLPRIGDEWAAFALRGATSEAPVLVEAWRNGAQGDTSPLAFPHLVGRAVNVETLYPAGAAGAAVWHPTSGTLAVRLPEAITARVYRLTPH